MSKKKRGAAGNGLGHWDQWRGSGRVEDSKAEKARQARRKARQTRNWD